MARIAKILIRSGTGVPNPADFDISEPAWNSTNGMLYCKTASGVMKQLNYNITTSTSDPTGGVDGDIWIKYTA